MSNDNPATENADAAPANNADDEHKTDGNRTPSPAPSINFPLQNTEVESYNKENMKLVEEGKTHFLEGKYVPTAALADTAGEGDVVAASAASADAAAPLLEKTE